MSDLQLLLPVFAVGKRCDTSLKLKEVLIVLQPIQTRWYELFLNLGVEREVLNMTYMNHPCDDLLSLTEAITHWQKRKYPPSPWSHLIDVVENILMEGTVAAELKRLYFTTEGRGILTGRSTH